MTAAESLAEMMAQIERERQARPPRMCRCGMPAVPGMTICTIHVQAMHDERQTICSSCHTMIAEGTRRVIRSDSEHLHIACTQPTKPAVPAAQSCWECGHPLDGRQVCPRCSEQAI